MAKDRSPEMSGEQMQAEILRVELETKQLHLNQARKDNADLIARDEQHAKANQQRMAELKQVLEGRYAVIKLCRHRSGGGPTNVLRGGGIGSFSLITRAAMPDGVTVFLQCPRCRLGMYTPTEKRRQLWFEDFKTEMEYFQKLVEQSIEQGIQFNETRGPTFMFKTAEGVPIIPERV